MSQLHARAIATVCVVKSQFPKMFHEDITTNQRQVSHSHVNFLLEELTVHLKTDGFQTSNNSMSASACKMDHSDNI
jgi:hypothetical protein